MASAVDSLYAYWKAWVADIETLKFATSAEFMRWAERAVGYKYQMYDRVPIGKQLWTYGDGHVAES